MEILKEAQFMCENGGDNCEACPLNNTEKDRCMFQSPPNEWDDEEIERVSKILYNSILKSGDSLIIKFKEVSDLLLRDNSTTSLRIDMAIDMLRKLKEKIDG